MAGLDDSDDDEIMNSKLVVVGKLFATVKLLVEGLKRLCIIGGSMYFNNSMKVELSNHSKLVIWLLLELILLKRLILCVYMLM